MERKEEEGGQQGEGAREVAGTSEGSFFPSRAEVPRDSQATKAQGLQGPGVEATAIQTRPAASGQGSTLSLIIKLSGHHENIHGHSA